MNSSIALELFSAANAKNLPLDVTWEITKNCNHSCKPCYVVNKRIQELTLNQGYRLVDSISDSGCLYLTFTGGEPFLRRQELKKWAFRAQNKNMAVSIFTNAALINKDDISWLKELMPVAVHISLFSADSRVHDGITGVGGSFKRSYNSVIKLLDAGIQVIIKTLLVRENAGAVNGIVELAKKLKCSYSFDPVVTPREDSGRSVAASRLSKKQIESVFMSTKDSFVSKFYPNNKDEFMCAAGVSLAAVSAYGDVYPCLMFPKSAGSVKVSDFADIWRNSIFLNKLRNLSIEDIKHCNTCTDLKYCSWCPGFAMLEDGSELGSSSVSCMLAQITKKVVASSC